MPQPYNLSVLTDTNTIVGLAQGANTISAGILGVVILLSVFFVLFMAMKQYDFMRAIVASSFITTLVAIFLRLLGLITDTYLFGTILISAVVFIWLKWSG